MLNSLEILRLDRLNHRQLMESTVHCSRYTVRNVLQAAKEKQVTWPLDDDIANAELEKILFPDKYKSGCWYVEPDYPHIHRELVKPGVTMALLWEEYYCRKCREAGEMPYMNTQFGDKYQEMGQLTKPRGHAHPAQLTVVIPPISNAENLGRPPSRASQKLCNRANRCEQGENIGSGAGQKPPHFTVIIAAVWPRVKVQPDQSSKRSSK